MVRNIKRYFIYDNILRVGKKSWRSFSSPALLYSWETEANQGLVTSPRTSSCPVARLGFKLRSVRPSSSTLGALPPHIYRSTSSYCTLQILHFLPTEGLQQSCIELVYGLHFSNSSCSFCVFLSHMGHSCNISTFLIIVIFVMVICDQWWFIEGSDDDYHFLAVKYFKVCTLDIHYRTLQRLQFNVYTIFICTGKTKPSCEALYWGGLEQNPQYLQDALAFQTQGVHLLA